MEFYVLMMMQQQEWRNCGGVSGWKCALLGGMLCLGACLPNESRAEVPKPYGAVPTPEQLQWHDMEMYAFVHFTLNTYTGKEWGGGDESPELFNPTDYDPDQVIGTLADAGFKGVILTCKHHDGFCLWPTKTTKHSVASSPWKGGKGDMVKDYAEACKRHGVKFGVYLSPWDRNHPAYGTPEYVNVYREQLKELLTQYGPVFIVWHDGAGGGEGYYGGAKDSRTVDKSSYYDWPNTWKLVKSLQPHAVIFSDVGPDVRWVGNESGFAGYPCWATYTPKGLNGKPPGPGCNVYQEGVQGTVNGKFWIPAEVDVSIRPGWFWKAHENGRVRTPENLMKLYFESVGRGADLNLNVPPDSRGRIHENDAASLKEFSRLLKQMYSLNLADGASVKFSSNGTAKSSEDVLDRKRATFWMAAEDDRNPAVVVKLPEARTFDVIRLSEPIQLGQRIRKFSVFVKENGQWVPWVNGSSVGPRVLLLGKSVTTDELKLVVEASDAPAALSEFSLWQKPQIVSAPAVSRDASGSVTLRGGDGCTVRYTLDGSEPGSSSSEYKAPLNLPDGGVLNVRAFVGNSSSATTNAVLPVATSGWKIVSAESGASDPARMIDGKDDTLWHTHAGSGEIPPPQTIDIDMGCEIPVASVLYTPRQDGNTKGIVNNYEVYVSKDGKEWGKAAAAGEFSNIKANPIRQRIDLAEPATGRFLRFVAKSAIDGNHVTVAELGILPAKPAGK
ncbi:alpha-l-fucosidase [Akkermansia glycaniphila]|uniref:alpha-L-fucosidase n=2 Tax=Akkermansia glycaniphila TaxID=1679444 RepID=A0A1H6K624_9BACT|nr:alpha-l-fucosidase [Akkermansia glycaniphila]